MRDGRSAGPPSPPAFSREQDERRSRRRAVLSPTSTPGSTWARRARRACLRLRALAPRRAPSAGFDRRPSRLHDAPRAAALAWLRRRSCSVIMAKAQALTGKKTAGSGATAREERLVLDLRRARKMFGKEMSGGSGVKDGAIAHRRAAIVCF